MMRLIIQIITLHLLFVVLSCQSQKQPIKSKENYNGFNFTGTSYRMTDFSSLDSLKNIGCNWVSFSPFRYMASASSPIIIDSLPNQWYGESKPGIIEMADAAHIKGIKVLVKPHLWIMNGDFTGDIKNPINQSQWENQYENYMLTYAKLCELHKVEMLSIGNELKTPVSSNPNYWTEMIKKIRLVYTGKLTYSANWDNFDKIPFWDKLDLIGINAYFPVCNEKTPSKKCLAKGWKTWVKKINHLKIKTQKPVIFTELGYRSTDYCCKQPWSFSNNNGKQNKCQENAYQFFFDNIYGKEVTGVFLWKYFDKNDPHSKNDHYSPQRNKSWFTIKKYFLNE